MSKQRPDRTHLLAQRRQFLLTLEPFELTGLIIDYGIQLDEDSNWIELILEHEFRSEPTSDFVSRRAARDAGPGHTELDPTVAYDLGQMPQGSVCLFLEIWISVQRHEVVEHSLFGSLRYSHAELADETGAVPRFAKQYGIALVDELVRDGGRAEGELVRPLP